MTAIYRTITFLIGPLLCGLLFWRKRIGKEDPERISERKGHPSIKRPSGKLIWLHAASVGEAQSALILIDRLSADYKDTHILITTGTRTSAALMAKRLPSNATHQFYPLDHPIWVRRFLNHWQPDLVLWMESELWPNMLSAIKNANIPATLVNARLSPSSYRNWKRMGGFAKSVLSTFSLIIAQSETETTYFKSLGCQKTRTTGNLKYSATPLDHDKNDIKALKTKRPVWLYASTHDGEEQLAASIHKALKNTIPDLLTIIAPRHPERADEIVQKLANFDLTITRRTDGKVLPEKDTDIYLADTLGELGLFYRLAPLCIVGRSFSYDGGGGHNPIEPALLNCAVFHGKNVQNLSDIYTDMDNAGAAHNIDNPDEIAAIIEHYLTNDADLKNLQKAGKSFAKSRSNVIDVVLKSLSPVLKKAL